MWKHLTEKGVILPKITSAEINKQVEPVLREMEKVGVLIDCDVLRQLEENIEGKIEGLVSAIHHFAGEEFNINSPQQLSIILFEKLNLPTKDLKRTKSGVSTGASELMKLIDQHPIVEPLLGYRELAKLLSTYLKPLPEMVGKDGRLHTTYGQETSTGRLTSANPNLQNIPIKGDWGAEIRKAFIAPEGSKIISADYSQIELRIVACLAQDPVMLQAFEGGRDVHAATAAEIFDTQIDKVTSDQRRIAKTVNFGVLYGMSPYGLSEALRISRDKAIQYIRRYFETHIGIKKYCGDMIKQAKDQGYTETLFGFRREFSNINSFNHNAAEAEERMAVNAPVQGSAAEVLKLAMIELGKRAKGGERKWTMVLTVHDELIFEVLEDGVVEAIKEIKEVMENVVDLCVPLVVEAGSGDNWADAKH
ncbi:MAG: DNA polymerase [Patescibacteria group bacterium]|jgi:DNA polymerase-1